MEIVNIVQVDYTVQVFRWRDSSREIAFDFGEPILYWWSSFKRQTVFLLRCPHFCPQRTQSQPFLLLPIAQKPSPCRRDSLLSTYSPLTRLQCEVSPVSDVIVSARLSRGSHPRVPDPSGLREGKERPVTVFFVVRQASHTLLMSFRFWRVL